MKRERVKRAVQHKQIDIIPHNAEFTVELSEKLARYLNVQIGDIFEWTGNHIQKFTCNLSDKKVGEHTYIDEYGVEWNRKVDKDIGVVDKPILSTADISGYTLPTVNRKRLRQGLDKYCHDGIDAYKFAKINFTLFERAWSLRGFQNILMDFILEKRFLYKLLDKITQRNLEIIEIAVPYDIDGMYFGDDFGQQTGMLMSPDMWREYFKPHYKEMFQRVKDAGKDVCLHSCGKIDEIIPDLIETGLDIYQTVQPEIYDLKMLKKEYGKDLTFYGGISTQRDLPHKAPNEIYDLIKNTMKIFGDSGGYICAPTHRVTNDVPIENIMAMIDAFKSQE